METREFSGGTRYVLARAITRSSCGSTRGVIRAEESARIRSLGFGTRATVSAENFADNPNRLLTHRMKCTE